MSTLKRRSSQKELNLRARQLKVSSQGAKRRAAILRDTSLAKSRDYDKALAAHNRLFRYHFEAGRVADGLDKVGHETKEMYHGLCAASVQEKGRALTKQEKRELWVNSKVMVEDHRYQLNRPKLTGRTFINVDVYDRIHEQEARVQARRVIDLQNKK